MRYSREIREFPAGTLRSRHARADACHFPLEHGGWVNSEVFDHTSLIRFIQARFGIRQADEKNITPWRTAVAGDLTSAFDFAHCAAADIPLPGVASYAPQTKLVTRITRPRPPNNKPCRRRRMVRGRRAAFPIPSMPTARRIRAAGAFNIRFANSGSQTAVFQVRSANTANGPWTYTVQPQAEIVDSCKFVSQGAVAYDLSVYGPNGFFRAYKGQSCSKTSTNLQSVIAYNVARGGITLQSQNLGAESAELQVKNLYDNEIVTRVVGAS